MKQCLIKYTEALNHIKEGDILLFRGNSIFSWFIQAASEGYYSHVGVASWTYDELGKKSSLECVEFREWIGSRAINLGNYVDDNPGMIDVFRPLPEYTDNRFLCKNREIHLNKKVYDGKKITDEFRTLTGLPYGWKRIFWLMQFHLIGIRLFTWKNSLVDNSLEQEYYPVCSTIVAHLFSKHYTDLVHFRSSSRTEPNDVARSPILNYIFTLVP